MVSIFIILIFPLASAAAQWIALDKNISNTSASSTYPDIKIDNNDKPHVVWVENDEVYYKKWNGGQWVTISDSADPIHPDLNVSKDTLGLYVAEFSRFEFDSSWNPFVVWHAFYGSFKYDTYMRKWNGNNWVDAAGNTGYTDDLNVSGNFKGYTGAFFIASVPNIDLNSSDVPYVTYVDAFSSPSSNRAVKWGGSSWVNMNNLVADPDSNIGLDVLPGLNNYSSGIFVGSDEVPYVLASSNFSGNFEIYLRDWNGTNWVSIDGNVGRPVDLNVSETNAISQFASIANDSSDNPYIVWEDYESPGYANILFRKWNDLNWVDAAGNTGFTADLNVSTDLVGDHEVPDIAVDSSNNPYVVWETHNVGILFRKWDNSNWVDAAGNVSSGDDLNVSGSASSTPRLPSVAIDSKDRPHIVWQDNYSGNVEIYYQIWDNPPDINITKIDGTDVNTGMPSFAYSDDSNVTISFNVSDKDQDDLNFNIWYSTSAADYTNKLISDLNLTDSPDAGNCDTNAWTNTVTCSYDFNISSALVSDGNYFIDVVLNDGYTTDTNSTPVSFMVDNTNPFTHAVDINYTAQNDASNLVLSCIDTGSGCSGTQYKLDTDGTSAFTMGDWTNYTTPISISADGNWAIDINSTDKAGNAEDVNRLYILINSSLPTVTISSPSAGTIFPTTTTSVTVTYSADQAINKYWIRLGNSGLYTDNGTNTTYNVTTTAGNVYEFYVIGTDATDTNSQPKTVRFEVPSQGGSIPSVCGDGICEQQENLSNCPQDCQPVCGDGKCTGTESILTCPRDCAVGCGNKICEENETCTSCSTDCGKCPIVIDEFETILEKIIVQQPTQQTITTILSSLGRTIIAIEKAIENHKKIEVNREILVQKEIETGNISTTISIILKNNTDRELRNIKVIDKIPKSVAESTDDIKTSYFFAVLEEDPTVQFTVPSIKPNSTVKVIYAIDAEVKEEQFTEFIPPIVPELIEFFQGLTCEAINCNDDNPCTLDRCYNTECSYIAVQDGTGCGFGKECSAGICRNIDTVGPD